MNPYVSLSDPIYDQIHNKIAKTYQNVCIVWIEKVYNKDLEERWQNYKKLFNTPNEKQLFHGTSERNARLICRDGFDPDLNKVSAYGLGIYFATKAHTSREYGIKSMGKEEIAYMLVCDVVLGNIGLSVGNSNKKIPKQYSSLCDNKASPDIFVVDKKEACLPRYLVAFYPGAK